ncbi:TolC family protein [Mangrovibacterium diazotrophicum]|uniref:Outer membrane protein TolC n=1 Tax=Mangrovibacterium diazotrophicum TaxID=1261403 RepID=A0A419W6G7_9BACT|nr:TolC family protein [Mangrovibacterium diazotrophicum]RKD91063.1 outer membrane protein TolC [Mangrovibacterium diazotrophicum]
MKTRISLIMLLLLPAQWLFAQQGVTLFDCQQWAREVHPLLKQKEIYQKMSELKLDNIQTAWYPTLDLKAQASYQSDVTRLGASLPGIDIPSVSKDQYKAYLDVKQNIWDGGVSKAKGELEKAQDLTNQQGVEVDLYQVKEQVNNLFFSSFLIQQNLDLLAKKQETLEARKKQMESALSNGAILQSDLDQVLAELVKVKQQQLELQSGRETTLAALAILTGKEPSDLQNLQIETSEVRTENEIVRPEIDLFRQQTDLLSASADLTQKARNPKLFGFGQAGYGRPAINMLNDDFDTYYLVGIGLNWTLFDWKQTKRSKEVIQLQQEMVQTQQTQFERNITIALDGQRRKIEQLQQILKSDRELIELQERITKSSASKLENGTITTADYLQDLNAELVARITFETHKVQLESAKVNYQNLLGQ